MSVKAYLALLVGVFVVALAVVGVGQRAIAGAVPAILVPVAVTLAAVAVGVPGRAAGRGCRRGDGPRRADQAGDRGQAGAADGPGGGRPGGRVAKLHTGRPRCGKIPMTGNGPARQRETGIRLADQQVIGKVGRVTGTIGPERVGEVMIAIRGGSEAFNAYAADTTDTISTGTRVVVIEYFPPRTVVVSPM
jgi:hypothetical protein